MYRLLLLPAASARISCLILRSFVSGSLHLIIIFFFFREGAAAIVAVGSPVFRLTHNVYQFHELSSSVCDFRHCVLRVLRVFWSGIENRVGLSVGVCVTASSTRCYMLTVVAPIASSARARARLSVCVCDEWKSIDSGWESNEKRSIDALAYKVYALDATALPLYFTSQRLICCAISMYGCVVFFLLLHHTYSHKHTNRLSESKLLLLPPMLLLLLLPIAFAYKSLKFPFVCHNVIHFGKPHITMRDVGICVFVYSACSSRVLISCARLNLCAVCFTGDALTVETYCHWPVWMVVVVVVGTGAALFHSMFALFVEHNCVDDSM